MPVSVDDPFLLASFSTTTHQNQQRQAVCCAPEAKQPTQDQREEEEDASSLLVVAIQGEGVQLFNTADQKCVLSYSTPPGYSFIGSAQTVKKSEKHRNVYAVIAKGTDVPAKEEGKVIWMWKDESSAPASIGTDNDNAMQVDVKPSTARKTTQKFERKIHQLFVSPLLPNHVLLTNTDGSISLVTEDLKRVVNTNDIHASTSPKTSKKEKKDAATQEHTISTIWSTTFNTTGSWIPSNALARNVLIIMTIAESGSEKIAITLSYVNEERRGFTTFGQVEIETSAGSSGFAFDPKAGQLSFMTVAGQLKIYSFQVSQGDYVVSVSETLNLPIPGYAASITANNSIKAAKKGNKAATEIDPSVQRVDTVALGDNYLAIAGIHKIDGKAEQTITIWDTKYGTLQAKHVVPGNFSLENTTCQLALLPNSNLVVTISTLHNTTMKSDIYMCPYYAEPMSLLGAMGRMKDSTPFFGQNKSTSQDAHTSTTTSLLAPADISGIIKGSDLVDDTAIIEEKLASAQRTESEVLEKLASDTKTSTAQSFEEVFFKHVEHQANEAAKDVMEKFGVESEKVKTAIEEDAKKKASAQKQQNQKQAESSQDMDIDTEPVVDIAPSASAADKSSAKKLKKKEAKAAAKAAKAAAKGATAAGKGSKKAAVKDTKTGDDGSSSESSSDEDDEEDNKSEAAVSSDEEQNEEEEEEQEYELAEETIEEQNKARSEYKTALADWRKIEAEAVKNYKIQRRLLRAGRKHVPPPELSHHFVTTVIGRCFVNLPNGQPDMSFWPAKVIEYLIENQLVGNANPGAGQSGIALSLMEREQWSLLELALTKLYDIPEMDLIAMLKQVIGLNKNKNSTETKKTSSMDVPDITHFLNLIMAAPKNEVFMQQAIKRMSVEELSVILDILKDWISIWDERGGIGHQGQPADSKQLPGGLPGYGLMVDFITLIMDVHFPLLILSPHLHPILKSIQTSIQQEVNISAQLEQALRGPLGLFDRKHREMIRRQKESSVTGFNSSGNHGIVNAAGGISADKRRRRRWEGGEGIPDYGVEIIHL